MGPFIKDYNGNCWIDAGDRDFCSVNDRMINPGQMILNKRYNILFDFIDFCYIGDLHYWIFKL